MGLIRNGFTSCHHTPNSGRGSGVTAGDPPLPLEERPGTLAAFRSDAGTAAHSCATGPGVLPLTSSSMRQSDTQTSHSGPPWRMNDSVSSTQGTHKR